jgi:hypothetical protein
MQNFSQVGRRLAWHLCHFETSVKDGRALGHGLHFSERKPRDAFAPAGGPYSVFRRLRSERAARPSQITRQDHVESINLNWSYPARTENCEVNPDTQTKAVR